MTKLTEHWRALMGRAMVVGAAGMLLAASARADDLQTLLDRVYIGDMLVRYTHALDTLDADKYASVFTADAVFEQGADQVSNGRAEIRDIIVGLQKSRAEREAAGTAAPALMHHVMTNATLELVSDKEAHHYAYWMTIITNAEGETNIVSMGHYEDIIVKRDGDWLIRSRKLLR